MPAIYPSLIAADPLNLQAEMERLDPHVIGYHLDIMDNHFVPNLTFGARFVNAMCSITRRQLWVHLMVDDPFNWLDELLLPPHSILTFHFESTIEKIRMIKRIKEKNWLASITINPKTDVEEIFPLLNMLDQVQLMSVEPGFSGQPFLHEVVKKIDPLIGYRSSNNLKFTIAMDGGIGKDTIGMLAQKDVDHFAVASAIFDQPDPIAALKELQELIGE